MPGVSSEVIEPTGVVRVPALRVRWDGIALDGMGLRQRLLDGSPRIMTDDTSATANSLTHRSVPVPAWRGRRGRPGDRRCAAAAHNLQPATEPAAAIDLSGNWEVRVQFLHGERKHRLRLQQQGSQLSGSQQSEQFESNVIGKLAAQNVRMEFETRHEGSAIAYRFEGTVNDGTMQGDVFLGSATDNHRGPVNLSQFGKGQWQAQRAA